MTGAARRWPRRAANATFAMSVDPEGAIWVAASPERAPVHVVARLSVASRTGGVSLAGWRIASGRLLPGAARADDAGLTLVTELAPRRSPTVRHHAAASLLRTPGGLDECF
ncbi:MAG: hypothetical protein KF729_16905 [Sandaracinaceae bacterium]|nr:hypothetical protein [Sandaracinaceae bacterium]